MIEKTYFHLKQTNKIKVLFLELWFFLFILMFVCFYLGLALLQTGNAAPALPPEGGFGSPRCLQIAVISHNWSKY